MVRVDKADFLERLALEGKRRLLDTKEDYERMYEMNKLLEQNRRDYKIKDYNSEINASTWIPTA